MLGLYVTTGSPGKSVVLRSPEKVALNQWNTVTFRRKGTEADLRFGGVTITSREAQGPTSRSRKDHIQDYDEDGINVLTNFDNTESYINSEDKLSSQPNIAYITHGRTKKDIRTLHEKIEGIFNEVHNITLTDAGRSSTNSYNEHVTSSQPDMLTTEATAWVDRLKSRKTRSTFAYLDVGNELFIGGQLGCIRCLVVSIQNCNY